MTDHGKRFVLVTGATGQLGKVLVARLKELPTIETRTVARIEDEFDLDWFSLRNQAHLTESVSLVHLAWNTSDRRKLAQQRSLNQTVELAKWCQQNGVRLLFISSMSSHPQAISNYGIYKYLAECAVHAMGGTVIKVGLVLTAAREGILGLFNKPLFGLLRVELVSPSLTIPIVYENEFLTAICKEVIHPTQTRRVELVTEWLSTADIFMRLHATRNSGVTIPVSAKFLMSAMRFASRFSHKIANLHDSLLGLFGSEADATQNRPLR